jgi:hypothetical protein
MAPRDQRASISGCPNLYSRSLRKPAQDEHRTVNSQIVKILDDWRAQQPLGPRATKE